MRSHPIAAVLLAAILLMTAGTHLSSVRAESRRSALNASPLDQATVVPSPAPTATLAAPSELEAQLAEAWAVQDWPLSIRVINQILQIDPNRAGMRDNLYAAHVNYGFLLYNEGKLELAKENFTRAFQIRPEDSDQAQYGLSLIQAAILTITPVVSPTPLSTAVPSPSGTIPPGTKGEHLVKTGDTLFGLARTYDTTVPAIMQANGLTSYIIWVGQILLIPSGDDPVPGPTIHTVLPGETLWSLARRYQTTVQAIMWANGLWDYTIFAGGLLIIPGPAEPTSPSQHVVHTVASGETIYGIAQHYHSTVSEIMQVNHLDSTLIRPGQLLIIPAGQ